MASSVALPGLFIGFLLMTRLVFGTTWVEAVFAGCILGFLFWLLIRSEERLQRVERCLGSDRE